MKRVVMATVATFSGALSVILTLLQVRGREMHLYELYARVAMTIQYLHPKKSFKVLAWNP